MIIPFHVRLNYSRIETTLANILIICGKDYFYQRKLESTLSLVDSQYKSILKNVVLIERAIIVDFRIWLFDTTV